MTNSIKFLWAAYIATWLIHGVYLVSLSRRYKRLSRRMKEIGLPASGRPASGIQPSNHFK